MSGQVSTLPPETEEWHEKHWHEWVTQYWPPVDGAPMGTPEQRARELCARADAERAATRNNKYETRAMALDLFCAIFPAGHPPPKAFVQLMRSMLALRPDHVVGGWTPGGDLRGRPQRVAMMKAAQIEQDYRYSREIACTRWMPVKELAHALEKRGHTVSLATLRSWRKKPAYLEMVELEPPPDAGPV